MTIVPLELKEANALVSKWHRHHKPCVGHRFSIGVVHDGTLRGAAIVGKELGYGKIQTYILDTEPGTTLIAAGWACEGPAGGGQWHHTDGKPRRTDQPTQRKMRWSKQLNPFPPESVL